MPPARWPLPRTRARSKGQGLARRVRKQALGLLPRPLRAPGAGSYLERAGKEASAPRPAPPSPYLPRRSPGGASAAGGAPGAASGNLRFGACRPTWQSRVQPRGAGEAERTAPLEQELRGTGGAEGGGRSQPRGRLRWPSPAILGPPRPGVAGIGEARDAQRGDVLASRRGRSWRRLGPWSRADSPGNNSRARTPACRAASVRPGDEARPAARAGVGLILTVDYNSVNPHLGVPSNVSFVIETNDYSGVGRSSCSLINC